jgi:DNA-binding HxlR family transcriptional regulator
VASRSYGQYCGVTTAVELIGERWALLIVRDLLVGPRRYTDLKQGLPKIPTNILSTRLKELQEGGVVRRVPLMNCGLVYELTDYGRMLEPVVLALGRWGFASMGEPGPDDVVTADSLTMALRTAFQPDVAESVPPADYEVHVGDVVLRVLVDGDRLTIAQLGPGAPPGARQQAGGLGRSPIEHPRQQAGGLGRSPIEHAHLPSGEPEIVFAAGPGIRRLISGELTPGEAIDEKVIDIVAGDATLLHRFAATFHIAARLDRSPRSDDSTEIGLLTA